MTQQDSLFGLIQQRIDSGDVQLPVFDSIALRIHREVRNGSMDADGLCLLMEKDPALVAEVMKMANSSYFAGLGDIRSLRDAIVRLGMNQVASIVMAGAQKRLYSASSSAYRSRLLKLWQHALAVGRLSKWIANRVGRADLAEDAFVVGMLHDIGKLSLLTVLEGLGTDQEVHVARDDVDRVLRDMSPSHGASLLMKWQLPESFSHAVMHHHDQNVDIGDTIVAVLRLANRIAIRRGISDVPETPGDYTQLAEYAAYDLQPDDAHAIDALLEDFAIDVKHAA